MNYKYHLDNSYSNQSKFFGDTRLWQIGRLYCNPSSRIKPHKHPELFELTVVTSGKGTAYTDGDAVPIKEGDIHLAYPYETHEIIPDNNEPIQYDFFAFMTFNEEYKKELYTIAKNNSEARKRIFHNDGICDLVREGIREINGHEKYSESMMTAVCEQIIIGVIRVFDTGTENERKNNGTDADSICYQAMSYIDSHLFSMKSLTEISESMNYNYSYLSNLFGKNMGQGLMDYYRVRRLEMAKRLLLERGRNITQIAEMLNYSSVYAFSRAFKSQYGLSPNQFKKQNSK